MLDKDAEGGGGTSSDPWTYGELTGACKYKAGDAANPNLASEYKVGGERYGGTVFTEELQPQLNCTHIN